MLELTRLSPEGWQKVAGGRSDTQTTGNKGD
jgi:hypothetical protein